MVVMPTLNLWLLSTKEVPFKYSMKNACFFFKTYFAEKILTNKIHNLR